MLYQGQSFPLFLEKKERCDEGCSASLRVNVTVNLLRCSTLAWHHWIYGLVLRALYKHGGQTGGGEVGSVCLPSCLVASAGSDCTSDKCSATAVELICVHPHTCMPQVLYPVVVQTNNDKFIRFAHAFELQIFETFQYLN